MLALSVSQGKKIPPEQYLVCAISVSVGLYFLTASFHYTLMPDKAYTKMLDELHKPDNLWGISKCYSGNQSVSEYFYSAMERGRNDIAWRIYGLPITMETYQKMMSVLISIIGALLGYTIRSLVMDG